MIPEFTHLAADPVSPHKRTDRELELAVLEQICNSDRVRQRDLAHEIGASLGMTNAIVKRLSRKGLLTLRKINNRNVVYAVTPAGVDAITRKSYRYLKNTIRSVVHYKDALESLVVDIKRKGYRRIVVVGGSDLAFVLEHFCGKYGVEYRQRKSASVPEASSGHREFHLYGEHTEPPSLPPAAAAGDPGSDSLLRILVAAQAGEPS